MIVSLAQTLLTHNDEVDAYIAIYIVGRIFPNVLIRHCDLVLKLKFLQSTANEFGKQRTIHIIIFDVSLVDVAEIYCMTVAQSNGVCNIL